MTMSKREISLNRAAELKSRIDDYLAIRPTIKKGIELQKVIEERKLKILEMLNATEENWKDYKWQLRNRISDVETLSKIINLSNDEKKQVKQVGEEFRWGISPYYASLIDPDDKYDPVKLQSVPSIVELVENTSEIDPMGEEYTNPAGSITRRYPDRLIINVTNECAMYCRHCQRRRNIGGTDSHKSRKVLQESIDYIAANSEIRDVLITGGDALALTDSTLEFIISQLYDIPHVEFIRLGTRMPVTMPQRVTDDLVNMLKKYHPIYLNTHFNHPQEVTLEAKEATEKLANAGISIGNQSVLLNGINNDKYVMRCLNHELLKIRVRPYYLFHAKHVIGTEHFVTSIDEGLEIMEYLRGYTSGLACPSYIVNAPAGNGKTPILPTYLISRGKDYVTIRTWEGKTFDYPSRPSVNIRKLM